MVVEDYLTLGDEHTRQYTNHVSYKYTFKTNIISLTNVTSINLIKNEKSIEQNDLNSTYKCWWDAAKAMVRGTA